MSEDLDFVHRQARKRQVSWDRAEKARTALAPYFQEYLENDVRFALTDFLVDVFHLADRTGFSLDKEALQAVIERSISFYADEEAVQYIPALGKVGT